MRIYGFKRNLLIWIGLLVVTLVYTGCSAASIGPRGLTRFGGTDDSSAAAEKQRISGMKTLPVDSPNNAISVTKSSKDGVSRMRRVDDTPQFNAGSYEKFIPSIESIHEIAKKFIFTEEVKFILDESKVIRGDRFETFEITMRLPSSFDFSSVTKLYAEELPAQFIRNDWVSELGRTTCFRLIEKDRNTVISIIGLKDNDFVDVKIRYHKLDE